MVHLKKDTEDLINIIPKKQQLVCSLNCNSLIRVSIYIFIMVYWFWKQQRINSSFQWIWSVYENQNKNFLSCFYFVYI